jgi:hypothetical protein
MMCFPTFAPPGLCDASCHTIIHLDKEPARYLAPFSGSGPTEENFAGFLPESFCFLRACFREKSTCHSISS